MSGDASLVELGTVNQDLGERLTAERQQIDHREENARILEVVLGRPNAEFDWMLQRRPFEKPKVKSWSRMVDIDVTTPMALGMLCGVNTEGQFTNLEANELFILLEARDMVLRMPQGQRQEAISKVANVLGIIGGYIPPKALQESIRRLSDLIKKSMPVHGGFGDGMVHIAYGIPLGRRYKNRDWPLVRQDALDVSDENVRWRFAPMVEFHDSSTGTVDRRREDETITFANERGVIVIDPITDHTSDIMSREAFAAATQKTGGLLAMDMINTRHSWNENNPVITAMTKDALRAAIAILSNAKMIPGEYRPSDVVSDARELVVGRRQILEKKLASLS